MGDELGTVVLAGVRRGWVETGRLLQRFQDVLGNATPAQLNGQAKAARLNEYVPEIGLRPAAVLSNWQSMGQSWCGWYG